MFRLQKHIILMINDDFIKLILLFELFEYFNVISSVHFIFMVMKKKKKREINLARKPSKLFTNFFL